MAQPNDFGPFYRGEDVELDFTMTPLTDITGWTISCRVKLTPTDATALLTVNATIQTAAAGTFKVPFTSAQTSGLSANTYAYDVWRTDSGSQAALSIGSLTIKGSPRTP